MLKRGIFSKFFVSMTLTCVVVGAFILIVTTRERTQALEEALVQENKLLIKIAANSIEDGYLMNFLPIKTLKEISEDENILFLWMVKPNGEIYFADNPEMWRKKIDDPFLGVEEVMVRDSVYPKDGKEIKLITHPIKREIGEKPWTLFLGVSLEQVAAAKKKVIFTTLGLFVMVLIFATFISFYLAKGTTSPLEFLRRGVEIIGKGNLDYRIEIKTGDEIEELGKTFNQMTENLKKSQAGLEESKAVLEIKVEARTKELEELAKGLDEKVKERTKKLEERVNEMERFHKLTVGRELKMIELKKELKNLKVENKINRS